MTPWTLLGWAAAIGASIVIAILVASVAVAAWRNAYGEAVKRTPGGPR